MNHRIQPKDFTDEEIAKITAAYTEHPGDHKHVSDATGIGRLRAQALYHNGRPEQNIPPIRDVVREKLGAAFVEEPYSTSSSAIRVGVGHTRISPEKIAALLAAYREFPGKTQMAADRARVSWQTATRAWTEGWIVDGIEAMRLTVEREQAEIRAKLEEARRLDAERAEAARQDALKQRELEGQLVRAAGQGARSAVAIGVTLLHQIAGVTREMQAENVKALMGMSFVDRVKATRTIIETGKLAMDLAAKVMEMERLHLGEPTAIIGMADIDSMSAAQAASEIKEAVAQFARARRAGVVIDAQVVEAEALMGPGPAPAGEDWEGDEPFEVAAGELSAAEDAPSPPVPAELPEPEEPEPADEDAPGFAPRSGLPGVDY